MWNWSVDEKSFKKRDPKGYRLWRLIQLINYGLDEGEKLDEKDVRASWSKIKHSVDPYKARIIEFLLWENQYSLPNNLTFWNWSQRKSQ